MNGIRERLKIVVYWMAIFLPLVTPFYLIRFQVGPLPTTILETYLLVFFVLYLLEGRVIGIRRAWEGLQAWRWPLLSWVAVSLASVFWSPSIFTGLGLWRAYVLEPVIAFIFLRDLINTPRDLRRLEGAMFLIFAVVVLWALIQFIFGVGIPSPWNVGLEAGRRATGPFLYPNALALFIVPIGAFAFYRWIEKRREYLYLAVWLLAFIGCFVVKSDGGFVALVVAMFWVLFLQRKTRSVALTLFVAGSSFVALVPALRVAFVEQVTFSGWSGRVRLWMWTETWNMLKDYPILGAGFGGYPVVFAPYHEKAFIEIFQYPHNIIFNFWSETGLLGLIVFGWILVTWLRERRSWIALAPLVAILIHGLVDVPYFKNDLAAMFWILIIFTTFTLDQKPVNR